MPKTDNNVTVVELNEGTKKLLSAMNFEPIPDEANYVAFFEDGHALFFATLDLPTPFILGSELTYVTYRTGVTLEF